MTQWIHDHRVPSSTIGGIKLDTVDHQWLPQYLRCHLELSSVMSNEIDAQRVKAIDLERLKKSFDDLQCVMDEYQI